MASSNRPLHQYRRGHVMLCGVTVGGTSAATAGVTTPTPAQTRAAAVGQSRAGAVAARRGTTIDRIATTGSSSAQLGMRTL